MWGYTVWGGGYRPGDTRLFRDPPNAEGNQAPDHDHVHKERLNHIMQFVRANSRVPG
jgi:hypothetical protein